MLANNDSSEEQIQIQVNDSSIATEQIENLFQPFMQVEVSVTRACAGTGLDLAINQCLCQMMGGKITVESELGKGYTFTVWLPVSRPIQSVG